MDGYRDRETLTSSDTSGLTGDESGEFAQQDSAVTETMSTGWTDEKHNLYLKSMEASFVNQLYNSIDLLGRHSQKEMSVPNLPQQVSGNTCTPTGQFKVLRHGSWQKINLLRPESQRSLENESQGFLRSPWVQHFRSTRKPQEVASPTLQESGAASQSRAKNSCEEKVMQCGSATRSKHSRQCSSSCHHDVVDCGTEMSDQNFVDEEAKDEKTSSSCSSKRMKTLMTDASCSDQVVPYGKPPVTEDTTGKCISSS